MVLWPFAIKGLDSLWKQRCKLTSEVFHFCLSEVDFFDNLRGSVSTQNQDFPGRSKEKAKNQYRWRQFFIVINFVEIQLCNFSHNIRSTDLFNLVDQHPKYKTFKFFILVYIQWKSTWYGRSEKSFINCAQSSFADPPW